MRRYASLLTAVGLVALTGCGAPLAFSPILERARETHVQVTADPLIVEHASLSVARADSQLREADRQFKELGDRAAAEHHAYLALRYDETAQQEAHLWSAQQELDQAETEHKAVLLQLSQRQTEQAQGAAAASDRAALEAQQRAEILAERLRELEARETERGLVLTLSDVLFDVDKVQLLDGGERAVGQLVTFLEQYPERTVLIEGHTDDTGDEAHNLDLSRRRAEAVQAAMTNRGIAPARIAMRGYGEAYPVAPNDAAAGRQQNRRVEVVISDAAGHVTER